MSLLPQAAPRGWLASSMIFVALVGPGCRRAQTVDDGNVVKVAVAAGSENIGAAQADLAKTQKRLAQDQTALERQRQELESGASGEPEVIKAKEAEIQRGMERIRAEQQKAADELKAIESERKRVAAQAQSLDETLKVMDGEDSMSQRETVIALKERNVAAQEGSIPDRDADVLESLTEISHQITVAVDRVRRLLGRQAPDATTPKAQSKRGKAAKAKVRAQR